MHLLSRLHLAVLPCLAALVAADFHIFNCASSVGADILLQPAAVPSNQYECDARVTIEGTGNTWITSSTSFWQVENLCGESVSANLETTNGTFSLYQGNGAEWIGTCSPGSQGEVSGCQGVSCSDDWICFTKKVCGY